jgi:hypothetical protein
MHTRLVRLNVDETEFRSVLRDEFGLNCPSSDKESQNRLMWERGSGASVE